MTEEQPSNVGNEWLTLPEVAETLGVELREVRGMLTDQRLLAVRRGPNKARSVPARFLLPASPSEPVRVIPSLRGTLIQLADAGLDEEETLNWLFSVNDELEAVPIEVLRAGHSHGVRRAAQSIAF